MANTFVPPIVPDIPPILPSSRGQARALMRFFPNRKRFVTVFLLSNGVFVQDTPTDENSNCDIPQPWNPYEPGAPYTSSSFYDYDLNQPVVVDTTLPVFILKQYGYGAQYVTDEEVTALTAAGYADCLS